MTPPLRPKKAEQVREFMMPCSQHASMPAIWSSRKTNICRCCEQWVSLWNYLIWAALAPQLKVFNQSSHQHLLLPYKVPLINPTLCLYSALLCRKLRFRDMGWLQKSRGLDASLLILCFWWPLQVCLQFLGKLMLLVHSFIITVIHVSDAQDCSN